MTKKYHHRLPKKEKTEYKTSQLKKHPLLAKIFPRAITGRSKMEKTK